MGVWCRRWVGLWKGLEVDRGGERLWESTARVWSSEGASCLWSLGPFHRNSAPASSASSTVSQPKAALEPVPRGLIFPASGAC